MNTSGNMAYCKVPHKQGWTKGTNCYSLSFRHKISSVEKANTIADCLEEQFTQHDQCEENHEQNVKARVQALLQAVDNDPLKE
jgi:ABC-type glutathione transport system ATPase component